jgi:uncharacterized membrane protein SpoIIM required for sporulation
MTEFIERRRPAWERLAALLDRAGARGSSLRRLSRDELRALGPLYRRAASDLSYARLRGADPALLMYLNDLVLRAHGLVYAERGPGGKRFWRFVTAGFPRLLRARQAYVWLAAAVFLLGGLLGAGLTVQNPDNGRLFLGERADDVNFYKELPQRIKDGDRPADAAGLMANNIGVAVRAFGIGILGGVPTLILLFVNGLPIGALAVLQHNVGYDVILWSFLLPHGVPELSAIFIAGGAGMLIGHALVAPGELSRADAVKVAGRDAVRLLFGTVMLFVIAGFIESFISPTALPAPGKFAFAALMAVALAAYCRLGRDPDPVMLTDSADSSPARRALTGTAAIR